jgi:predicted RNase H-like HicB family nuclease
MRYPIVIEKTGNGYGGHVVDVPELHAAGDSPKEVRGLLQSILAERICEMRANGERVPKPTVVRVDSVEIG